MKHCLFVKRISFIRRIFICTQSYRRVCLTTGRYGIWLSFYTVGFVNDRAPFALLLPLPVIRASHVWKVHYRVVTPWSVCSHPYSVHPSAGTSACPVDRDIICHRQCLPHLRDGCHPEGPLCGLYGYTCCECCSPGSRDSLLFLVCGAGRKRQETRLTIFCLLPCAIFI